MMPLPNKIAVKPVAMKTLLPTLMLATLLAGCGKRPDIALSSFASLDPRENKELKGKIDSLGSVDKIITVEGTPTSLFSITVGVSANTDSASEKAYAQVPFEVEDGKLSPLLDHMSGTVDGPSLRRESDNEITVYYPIAFEDERTWVKFKVMKK